MKQVKDVLDMFYNKVSPVGTTFLHSYPDGYSADSFIVINTLSVPADSIQTVDVNVNCYHQNYQGSIPDIVALADTADDVITAVHGYHTFDSDKVYIGFEFMNIIREEGMHYANLRFQLIFLNN